MRSIGRWLAGIGAGYGDNGDAREERAHGEPRPVDGREVAREENRPDGEEHRPDYVKIERHVLGAPARSGGVGWLQRQTDTFDGATQFQVEEKEVFRCESCGCYFGYGPQNVVGVCGVCGRTVCTGAEKGSCARHCERCGGLTCGRCAVTWGSHVFCARCRWALYWRSFWGVLDR